MLLWKTIVTMVVRVIQRRGSCVSSPLGGITALTGLLQFFSLFHAFLSQYLSGGAYTPPPSTNRVKYYMFLT